MKILVAVYSEIGVWNLPPVWVDELRTRFRQHTFVQVFNAEEFWREIVDADVLFGFVLSRETLAAARRLRWVQASAAGIRHLLFPEFVRSEIPLTNTKGLQSPYIAEHVMALALALARKLHTAVRRQAQHVWAQHEITTDPPTRLLRGRVMGIVGLGDIGGRVAQLAFGFGMRLVAVRRRPDGSKPACVEHVWGPDGLTDLLAMSDVVVITTAHTGATRGLVGTKELRRMKPDAILINVARGRIIKEDELAAELAAGTIGGAGLDVFEREPLDPASPLWDLPNVIITPHSSGFNSEYWPALIDLFSENLRRFERGESLLNVVDKQAGY